MKESDLRKHHRNLGICLALLIFLQAVSGLVITLNDLSVDPAHAHGDIAAPPADPDTAERHPAADTTLLDYLSIIHHGGGTAGMIYRLVVGIGLVWMALSGSMIYFRIQARNRNRPRK